MCCFFQFLMLFVSQKNIPPISCGLIVSWWILTHLWHATMMTLWPSPHVDTSVARPKTSTSLDFWDTTLPSRKQSCMLPQLRIAALMEWIWMVNSWPWLQRLENMRQSTSHFLYWGMNTCIHSTNQLIHASLILMMVDAWIVNVSWWLTISIWRAVPGKLKLITIFDRQTACYKWRMSRLLPNVVSLPIGRMSKPGVKASINNALLSRWFSVWSNCLPTSYQITSRGSHQNHKSQRTRSATELVRDSFSASNMQNRGQTMTMTWWLITRLLKLDFSVDIL